MAEYQIRRVTKIEGFIKVITGLRIGASQDTMEIGGNDNPILRNPGTSEPYIPGSSLKGKMRALLEWYLGKVTDGKPSYAEPIGRIFGVPANEANNLGPARIIVRDAFLSEEDKQKFLDDPSSIVEIKHENTIDRLTSKATPRPMERVVPGVKFEFEIIFREFSMDNGKGDDYLNYVKQAMKLLEYDYLGSCGTRGCGKIKFLDKEGNELLKDVKLDL